MNWIDRLERRWGRFCIPNLMAVILCGQAAVWAVTMFVNRNVYTLLTLTRAGLARGEIWRLVTFVFVPDTFSVFGFLLGLYMYWFIGSALEHEWGEFRFNLYYLLGMLGSIAAALLTGSCSNYCLNLSLFLAFAVLFPNVELLLFFLIPVRVKWLGILAAAIWALSIVTGGSLGFAVQMLLGMLGFAVMFGGRLVSMVRARIRREQWRRKNRSNWR